MKHRLIKQVFSPKWLITIVCLLLIVRLVLIPIQVAVALYQTPEPEAIFILGGGQERQRAGAKLAQTYPALPIWISTGSSPDWIRTHFQEAGITLERLHLDYCAVDTLTNFTCFVPIFRQLNIHHVYLVTTDFHIPRSVAIAFFVFGSQSIAVTPVAVPSQHSPESRITIFLDSLRSMIWVLTRRTFRQVRPRSEATAQVRL